MSKLTGITRQQLEDMKVLNNVRYIQFDARYKIVKNPEDNYNIIHQTKKPGATIYNNLTRKKAINIMDGIVEKAKTENRNITVSGRGQEMDLNIDGTDSFQLRLVQV